MKLKTAIVSVLIAAFVLGCVSFTPETRPGAAVNSEKAYVFGRFNLRIEKGAAHIAVNLRTENGKNYTLPLKTRDDVYAVCLPPGTYRVVSVYFLNELKNKIAERALRADEKFTRGFTVRAGDLFYIGDYQGMIRIDGGESTFALESVENRYDAALDKILAKYGAFGKLNAKSLFY